MRFHTLSVTGAMHVFQRSLDRPCRSQYLLSREHFGPTLVLLASRYVVRPCHSQRMLGVDC